MSVDKAFAALGIGAAGSVGTYFLVVRSGDAGPVLVTQAGEKEKKLYEGDSNNTKIGHLVGYLLVATDEAKNETWWKNSYGAWKTASGKNNTSTVLGAEFATDKIKEGFDVGEASGDTKTLNQACKEAYGKPKNDITSTSGTDDQAKRNAGLWTYCSILGEKPKTIKEDYTSNPYNGANTKIGKKLENDLLSAKEKTNTNLWNRKNDEFFKKAPLDTDKYFNKFFKENQDRSKPNVKSLKDACKDAYGKESASETSSDTTPSDTEIKKYCSLLGE